MGRMRGLLAGMLLLALLMGDALAASPMHGDFSLGWKQLSKGYQGGTGVSGTQHLTLTRWGDLQGEALDQLRQILGTLYLSFSLRQDGKLLEVAQNGAPALSLWQTEDAVWQTLGSSLMTQVDGLGIPRATGEVRQQGYSRLESLPGLGTLLTHPAVRCLLETRDPIPVADVFLRQWERLQIAMSAFADEGATRSGMGGIDQHIHCTTYVMNGADIASALSIWLSDMRNDETMVWWLDLLGILPETQPDGDAWLLEMSGRVAQMTDSKQLNLRVYLDLQDEVCGIAGSTTLRMGEQRIPLSVTYKKKTSGNKVRHSLDLNCQPDGTGNGAKLDLVYVTSDNEKDRTARSLDATVSGYWMGEAYRIKLSWQYENLWTAQGGSAYAENIQGSGSLDVRYGNATVESLSWRQTQQIFVDTKDASRLAIEDSLTVDGLTLAGTLQTTLRSGSGQTQVQAAEECVSLASLDEQTVEHLSAQLRRNWDAWLDDTFADLAPLLQNP